MPAPACGRCAWTSATARRPRSAACTGAPSPAAATPSRPGSSTRWATRAWCRGRSGCRDGRRHRAAGRGAAGALGGRAHRRPGVALARRAGGPAAGRRGDDQLRRRPRRGGGPLGGPRPPAGPGRAARAAGRGRRGARGRRHRAGRALRQPVRRRAGRADRDRHAGGRRALGGRAVRRAADTGGHLHRRRRDGAGRRGGAGRGAARGAAGGRAGLPAGPRRGRARALRGRAAAAARGRRRPAARRHRADDRAAARGRRRPDGAQGAGARPAGAVRPRRRVAGRRPRLPALPGMSRPLLMGIVNANPDSFSDARRLTTLDGQVAEALDQVAAGADIIDVGGESGVTYTPLTDPSEEIGRVVPLVERLAAEGVRVSVDTFKAPVVAAALEAGAAIINDVSGLADIELARLCADAGAALVVMHTRAAPKQVRFPSYDDVVADVLGFLEDAVARAQAAGVESVIVDPGPDFAKTPADTVAVLRAFERLVALGHPVLAAVSRKYFLGAITGRPPDQRLGAAGAPPHGAAAAGAADPRGHPVPPAG